MNCETVDRLVCMKQCHGLEVPLYCDVYFVCMHAHKNARDRQSSVRMRE